MLYITICTIFAIPHLQQRLILERDLPKLRQLLDPKDRKMRRMILTACSISLFCLVLERASDNGSKLVCSLSLLQFRSDIGTPNSLKKENRMLFNSRNEFYFYPK